LTVVNLDRLADGRDFPQLAIISKHSFAEMNKPNQSNLIQPSNISNLRYDDSFT